MQADATTDDGLDRWFFGGTPGPFDVEEAQAPPASPIKRVRCRHRRSGTYRVLLLWAGTGPCRPAPSRWLLRHRRP